MNDLIKANFDQLRQTQANRDAKLIIPEKLTTTGIYQGYDSDLERHLVQTADGGLIHGLLESTGAAAVGDGMSISLTSGGIPRFFVTPH